jgi:hypothetical protein
MFGLVAGADLMFVQFGTLDWHEMAKFAIVVAVVLLIAVRLVIR